MNEHRRWTSVSGYSYDVTVVGRRSGELTGEERVFLSDGTVVTRNGSRTFDGSAVTGEDWGWLR